MNNLYEFVESGKHKHHLCASIFLYLSANTNGEIKLVSPESIASNLNCTNSKFDDAVIELIESGFLRVKNHGVSKILFIASQNLFGKLQKATKLKAFGSKSKPLTFFAICDTSNASLVLSEKANQPYYSIKKYFDNNALHASPTADAFLYFWSLYPKKTGKIKDVRKHFERLAKKHREKIIERLHQMYQEDLWPDQKWCKKPLVWLEGREWEKEKPKKDGSWREAKGWE